MAITRTPIVNDDGTLTTGTVLNTAWKDELYDQIDAAIGAAVPSTPISVANGGTGATTLTAKGVVFGNGTSAVGITAVGTAGDVLTSGGAGVSPAFAAAPVTLANTVTLTNKRVTPRAGTVASSGTPTINTDTVDAFSITALAAAITSMTTNLTGTPTDFQKLIIRIKDNGTARAITWGASFEAAGVALPTTTVISKRLTVGFLYDTVTSKWGCVASAQEA